MWEFLRFFYWRVRRDRKAAAHMLSMILILLRDAIYLMCILKWFGDRRPTVAIALMEHMGDIIAAEPVARMARRRFPDARIIWFTRGPYASLPESYAAVDQVFPVQCLTEWMLLRRLGLFDEVWDLHANGRMCPYCSIPQMKDGLLPDQGNYYHHGTLLEVQCDSAGLPRLNEGPVIKITGKTVGSVDALDLPPRFVAIHCTSSDPNRDWPSHKWRQMIERILATLPLSIVEVGLLPLVVLRDDNRQHSLCGKLTMLETAETLRRAQLFIGIDSGPAHLANAVATPGVILLGAYRGFQSYMPYNGGYANAANADILRADGMAAILPVDEVFRAVMKRLAIRDGSTPHPDPSLLPATLG